jgi:hypothetical protein
MRSSRAFGERLASHLRERVLSSSTAPLVDVEILIDEWYTPRCTAVDSVSVT